MYNVLIADDEATIISGLQCLIHWEDYGLEVKGVANNGKIALDMLMGGDYDILLTDVKMPYMDGLDLLAKIQENKLNIKSIIISGYDEFNYVKRAIPYGIENYLLKPVNEEELSSSLLNIVGILNKERNNGMILKLNEDTLFNNVFSRMMSGNIETDELQNRAQLLKIDLGKKYYLTATVKFYLNEMECKNPTCPVGTVQDYINECSRQIKHALSSGDKKSCCYLSYTTRDEFIILIGDDTAINPADVRNVLMTQLSFLYEKIQCGFFAAIGSLAKGIEQVTESFSNSQKMLAYEFVMEHNNVVNYEGMVNRSSNLSRKLNIDYRQIDSLLQYESTKSCISKLDDVFSELKKQSHLLPYELKCLIVDLFFHVFGSCENSNSLQFTGNIGSALFDILNMTNIEDIRCWFIRTAEEIIRKRDSKKENILPIARSILDYVDNHYSEDICLKTIADKLNLNPTYCGQIFKQETSVLFTDYLCNYRIEKAKYLLQSTNMKSCDIAVEVGFSNSNYFANVFRKKVGLYPSRYKKECS